MVCRERGYAVSDTPARCRVGGEVDPDVSRLCTPDKVRLAVVEGRVLEEGPERPRTDAVVLADPVPERADNLDAGDVRGAVFDRSRLCGHVSPLPAIAGRPRL